MFANMGLLASGQPKPSMDASMPQLPLVAQHPVTVTPIKETGSQSGSGGGGAMHIPLPSGGGALVPQTPAD
jgi:hypothetical protein